VRHLASSPQALASLLGGQRLFFVPVAVGRAFLRGTLALIPAPQPTQRAVHPASLTIYGDTKSS